MSDGYYSRDNGYPCEYDNYPIPPYNPDFTQEEREERIRKAHEKLEKTIQMIKSGELS